MIDSKHYPEEQLIANMLSGKKEAFDHLYRKYSPSILGYLQKALGDKQQAEELLNHVFINIWNNIDTYDPCKSTLFLWMFRLTKSYIMSQLTQQKNIQNIEIHNHTEFVNMSINSHEEDIEVQNIVLNCLYFNNYSLKTTSEILNIGEDQIKLLLRKAISNTAKKTVR